MERKFGRSAGILTLDAGPASFPASALRGWRNSAAIRAETRPILLAKRRPQDGYRRVLITTDFSRQSLLAARAACELAPDAEFVAVHAFCAADEGTMLELGLSSTIIRSYRKKAREVARQRLEEFVNGVGTKAKISRAILYGHPKLVLPHYALNIRADLVTLGHSRKSSWETLLGMSMRQRLEKLDVDLLLAAHAEPRRSAKQTMGTAARPNVDGAA